MAVRAFEAAARLASFTAAADELLLTQSAISRHVRNLEETLQVSLFQRRGRQINLTSAGRAYMEAAGDALDRISAATAQLRETRDRSAFVLSMPPPLAVKWFTPRLIGFLKICPGLNVQIRASCRIMDLEEEGVDAAIRYGSGDWGNVRSEPLLREQVFPVCSPSYLERCGKLVDLSSVTFLQSSNRERWKRWLRVAEHLEVDQLNGPQFDDEVALLQAAIDGLGLALGRSLAVERDLMDGRLAMPFPITIDAEDSYWLVTPKCRPTHPLYGTFQTWLKNELFQSRHTDTLPNI